MLKVKGLTHRFGRRLALKQLNLTLDEGEVHGLVGPNGAGKTTALRILAMLLNATSGCAELDGIPMRRTNPAARALVGYMPDFFGIYDKLRVWEYLDFYARCYGMHPAERCAAISRLLELVGLSARREDYVDILSRGMKQRLCMARALIHDPRLLIFDEPASGMDPRARADMMRILCALRDMGKMVLVSSHILPELAEICDGITILDRGKCVFSGSVDALNEKIYGAGALDICLAAGSEDAQMARALQYLGGISGVSDLRRMDAQRIRVQVAGGDERRAEILRGLMAAEIPVCDFHTAPTNLEKVFMEVTGNA